MTSPSQPADHAEREARESFIDCAVEDQRNVGITPSRADIEAALDNGSQLSLGWAWYRLGWHNGQAARATRPEAQDAHILTAVNSCPQCKSTAIHSFDGGFQCTVCTHEWDEFGKPAQEPQDNSVAEALEQVEACAPMCTCEEYSNANLTILAAEVRRLQAQQKK